MVAVILMAIFTAINFLGVRKLAHGQQHHDVVEGRDPHAEIIVLSIANFDTRQPHRGQRLNPGGLKAILLAVRPAGSSSSYLGFGQADQLAGESKNPRRDVPLAIIGSIAIGTVIYVLLQVAFLMALPSSGDR